MSVKRQFYFSFFSLSSFFIFLNACGDSGANPIGSGSSSSTNSGGMNGNPGGGTDTGSGSTSSGGGTGSGSTAGTGGADTGLTNGAGDGDGDVGFVPMPPAGTSSYNCSAAEGSLPPIKLTEIAGDLDEPVLVTHAPNDNRLFIVQRDGKIRVYQNGSVQEEPFLDIEERVVSDDDTDVSYDNGDRALGGLTFHPDYASNGTFYVYYNTTARDGYNAGDALLAEYKVSSNANVADRDSERVLLHIARNGKIDHHGGGLAFGGDGYLYLGLGDGNSWAGSEQQADPDGNGQNPATLLGTVLRIEPVLGGSYTVPSGNLKDTLSNAAPEIWDYGLRNPFRLNFDGCTGTLYIGDVGFQKFEEINIELPGRGAKNYGWPIMEGPSCETEGCSTAGLVPPGFSYEWLSSSKTTVIGGAVYRGSAIPALRGKYIYADFLRNSVYYLSYDETTETVSGHTDISAELDYPSAPTSVQTGYDGEIYITSYGGKVYRLDPE